MDEEVSSIVGGGLFHEEDAICGLVAIAKVGDVGGEETGLSESFTILHDHGDGLPSGGIAIGLLEVCEPLGDGLIEEGWEGLNLFIEWEIGDESDVFSFEEAESEGLETVGVDLLSSQVAGGCHGEDQAKDREEVDFDGGISEGCGLILESAGTYWRPVRYHEPRANAHRLIRDGPSTIKAPSRLERG